MESITKIPFDVGDNGTGFLAVRNKTSHENITIQSKTVLVFVFELIAVEQTGQSSALLV